MNPNHVDPHYSGYVRHTQTNPIETEHSPRAAPVCTNVIRLETQYWSLVEIPRQEKAETVPAFVLRACTIMEKTQKSGEGGKDFLQTR
ncbi:hypothetical protein EVAR_57811_1 [Eumeta japonica]|uniref:Uncharacterized protein n=1 Tax=Eumeta variegata TaxID=151549 RepID=A0A4C1Z8K8_EUMVA|nr:hypothetical protein EVAR_57811_1 [Eumeta japonica]